MRDTPEKYRSSASICSGVSSTSIPNSDDYVFNAMHPNYQNMMNDSHLIDRCSEAQIDIEAVQRASLASTLNEFNHNLQPYIRFKPETTSLTISVQQMLEWIRIMDTYVNSVTPSFIETKRMNLFERNTRYQEAHELRKYIASYDMTVKRLIRSSSCQILDAVDLNSLQEQYHCLLLRAYETQCLLEGFPGLDEEYQSNRQSPECARSSLMNMYKLCEIDIRSSSRNGSSVESTTNRQSDYLSGNEQYDRPIYTPPYGSFTPTTSLCDEILHIIKQPADGNESNSSAQKLIPNHANIRIVNRKKNQKVNQWLKRNPANMQRKYFSSESSESPLPGYDCLEFMVNDNSQDEKASITDSTSGIGNSISNASNEQFWDDYQETYSLRSLGASSESYFDIAATERLLNFGDDYSELLRSRSTSNESLKSSNLADTIPIEDNFMFFNANPSIRSINDLLETKDSTFLENIILDRRYRRQRGIQSTTELNNILRLESTNSLHYSSTNNIYDSQIENLYLRGSRTSCYSDSIRQTDSTTVNVTTIAKRKCASPISKHKKLNRKYHTRVNGSNRFRRCVSNNKVTDLLLVNVKQMKAEDIETVMTICKNNVSCLNSVLVGRSGDRQFCRSLQSRTTVDIGTTSDSDRKYDECQCGIIACYVQRIVDFVLDYTNLFLSCRLYNNFMMLLKQLYKMVKFLSVRTANYRRKYNSIEFMM